MVYGIIKNARKKLLKKLLHFYPDAKPSLDFHNHFELLCRTVQLLSAQTTDGRRDDHL